MRLLCLALLALGLVWSRPAQACGEWQMQDLERSLRISYLINAASIRTEKKVLDSLYLDIDAKELRTVRDKKVQFAIKGSRLTRYGKPIATLDGTTLTFGTNRVYTIELTNPHDLHGMPAWDLTVKRGDKTILTSTEASALCAPMHRDPPATAEQMQDEVRRRVIFYLAWRETGARP